MACIRQVSRTSRLLSGTPAFTAEARGVGEGPEAEVFCARFPKISVKAEIQTTTPVKIIAAYNIP